MRSRPRWHDVLIVIAIVAIALTGVWALWWGDVRPDEEPPPGGGSSVPLRGPNGPAT